MSKVNLFIDTNIYLDFYHLTSEDIEELKKLLVAIKAGKLKLYLTEQVKLEYERNRENKISDALKTLESQSLPNKFPQIFREYNEEFELINQGIITFQNAKNKILERLKKDLKEKKLKADELIYQLFDKAIIINTDSEIFTRAEFRTKIGNPPGKNGSMGDAINWESLLHGVPLEESIYFIADDRDYISLIEENCLKTFLLEEWEIKKKSKIFFYRKLSLFF